MLVFVISEVGFEVGSFLKFWSFVALGMGFVF